MVPKDTGTPVFTEALLTVPKTWKQPKCASTDEWIKKTWCIHTTEYYSAIKKNSGTCSNMDEPGGYHTE